MSLRSTLETHPNVFEVHFDTTGAHYFNVFEYHGAKFGQFISGVPVLISKITETKTREEVLGISRNFDTTDKADFVEQQIEKSNKKFKR